MEDLLYRARMLYKNPPNPYTAAYAIIFEPKKEGYPMNMPLSEPVLMQMHAYWRAANYLSVGQIYLRDNPLLREPLTIDHIKPRLLGHFDTVPGLNLIYVHLNRLIRTGKPPAPPGRLSKFDVYGSRPRHT